MQNIHEDFYFTNDLYEIFGVRQKNKLIEVLNKNGIRYFENGHGHPFVQKSEFERKPSRKRTFTDTNEWVSNKMRC